MGTTIIAERRGTVYNHRMMRLKSRVVLILLTAVSWTVGSHEVAHALYDPWAAYLVYCEAGQCLDAVPAGCTTSDERTCHINDLTWVASTVKPTEQYTSLQGKEEIERAVHADGLYYASGNEYFLNGERYWSLSALHTLVGGQYRSLSEAQRKLHAKTERKQLMNRMYLWVMYVMHTYGYALVAGIAVGLVVAMLKRRRRLALALSILVAVVIILTIQSTKLTFWDYCQVTKDCAYPD